MLMSAQHSIVSLHQQRYIVAAACCFMLQLGLLFSIPVRFCRKAGAVRSRDRTHQQNCVYRAVLQAKAILVRLVTRQHISDMTSSPA